MNSAWMRSQDRKRSLAAALSTLCLYAIAFLAAWLLGSLAPRSLASTPSAIVVDLGGGEGPRGAIPQGLENAPDRPAQAPPGAAPLPAPQKTEQSPAPSPPQIEAPKASASTLSAPIAAAASAAAKPSPANKAATIAAAPVKAAPSPIAKAAPSAKPSSGSAKTIPSAPGSAAKAAGSAAQAQAAAAQKAAAEAAAEAERQAEAKAAAAQAALEEADAAALAAERAAGPKTKTFGSSPPAGAPVTSNGTGSSPGVAGGTGTVTFRGSEMGSALVTTFGASEGLVGRNLYVDIYRFLPLPATVDESIYLKIAAKETFRSYYESAGSGWKLKAQPPVAERDNVWNMLEDAGYDASKADFRNGAKLSPVVLEFVVGPLAKNKVELVDVRIVSSSGSPEIDEAIVYGFRQASFFNKTGNAVSGKFVYSF